MASNAASPMSSVPASILQHYGHFRSAATARTGNGLINQTFLAAAPDGDMAIFQRLHHIFAPTVNQDIHNVTEHLARKGVTTPRLIPTDTGDLFVMDDEGFSWRALTFVSGQCFDSLSSGNQAFEAARLVARFHRALMDYDTPFVHVRPGVHDIERHLNTLRDAVENHPGHRLMGQVAPLAEELLRSAESLPSFDGMPLRTIHGDLKISNLMFDEEGRGKCLIDLDTMASQKWVYEMGDALRSWCNTSGEDTTQAQVNLDLFSGAVKGYFMADQDSGDVPFPSRDEAMALVDGLAYICLELTSRFLADALNESYFGYNAAKFPARGEHNLLRAQGQWSLYRNVMERKGELTAILKRAVG